MDKLPLKIYISEQVFLQKSPLEVAKIMQILMDKLAKANKEQYAISRKR